MALAYPEAAPVVSFPLGCQASSPSRRTVLCAGLAVSIAGAWAAPARSSERLQTPEDLLAVARQADWLLLGELHDQPEHHRVRAQLLLALRPDLLVFEQLPLMLEPQRLRRDQPLLPQLEALGFDAKAWGWPLHEPLFQIAASLNIPLKGGNLTRPQLREISQKGLSTGLPEGLREAYQRLQPLEAQALSVLQEDLRVGHCGMLPEAAIPGMVTIQRIRDLCMAEALAAAPRGVLIAGNGHVRKDYGVPTVLQARSSQARITSIGFLEGASSTTPSPADQALYDAIWTSPSLTRPDPCEAFRGRQA